jgi:PadR family transcriptional regulator, regulatory protein PadR
MEGEMLKGDLDMIVLAALASGPAHGYAVIQEIRRRSGGAFVLPERAIYPALHRLEQSACSAAVGRPASREDSGVCIR